MAKVKLTLDTRNNRIKKDGTYPLVLFLSHKRKSARIGLKYSFASENWNDEMGFVTGVKNDKHITAKVQSLFSTAQLYINSYVLEIENMDIKELKSKIQAELFSNASTKPRTKKLYISKRTNTTSLFQMAEEKIERLKNANQNGNAAAINTSIESLKRFVNKDELLFSEVDLSFIKDFVAYCNGRGNKPNTISAYLRPVKTLFNEALQEDLIDVEMNPFPKFKMPRAKKTKKRALRMETIQEIRKLELKPNSALWDAKNYFLFMFNNMGINMIDMAKLKRYQILEAKFSQGQLISGRLVYTRSKNGRQYSIKLTQESIDILNRYNLFEKGKNDFIFPIGFTDTEKGYRTYKKKRQRINGRIRKLGKMIGLEENITSYYARHSWATIAKRKMIPISVIAEGLGHSDLKTTQIYLDSFDDDILDNANESIVE